MTAKAESRTVASVYIALGVWCALMTPKMYSIMDILEDPPFFTRAVFFVGSVGWFVICGAVAGLVLWKDTWKRLQPSNSLFAMAFPAIVSTFAIALFLPFVEICWSLAH